MELASPIDLLPFYHPGRNRADRPDRLEPARVRRFRFGYYDLVKRALAGIVLLATVGAAVYGFAITRRERNYRLLIQGGEAALARDDTSAAGEAFSGAIALKPGSMLGYLKGGGAYR